MPQVTAFIMKNLEAPEWSEEDDEETDEGEEPGKLGGGEGDIGERRERYRYTPARQQR
jgi:hypothetical protein